MEEERIRSDPDRIDELEMLEDDKLLFGAADKVRHSSHFVDGTRKAFYQSKCCSRTVMAN